MCACCVHDTLWGQEVWVQGLELEREPGRTGHQREVGRARVDAGPLGLHEASLRGLGEDRRGSTTSSTSSVCAPGSRASCSLSTPLPGLGALLVPHCLLRGSA